VQTTTVIFLSMLALLFGACLVAAVAGTAGRIWVRLYAPFGLTWPVHSFVSWQALSKVKARLGIDDYALLIFRDGYFTIHEPDAFFFVNIPTLILDWVFYALWLHVVVPLLFGRVPIRYQNTVFGALPGGGYVYTDYFL